MKDNRIATRKQNKTRRSSSPIKHFIKRKHTGTTQETIHIYQAQKNHETYPTNVQPHICSATQNPTFVQSHQHLKIPQRFSIHNVFKIPPTPPLTKETTTSTATPPTFGSARHATSCTRHTRVVHWHRHKSRREYRVGPRGISCKPC